MPFDVWKPVSGGSYKLVQHSGSVSTGTPTSGNMYLIPFFGKRGFTIAQTWIEVTQQAVSVAGTDVLRMGIYDADATTGRPSGAASADFGTYDLETNAAAVLAFNHTDFVTLPQLYWFAIVRQTTGTIATPAILRLQVPGVVQYPLCYQTGTPTIGTDGASRGVYLQTSVTGTLPTIGTIVPDATATPVVLFQAA